MNIDENPQTPPNLGVKSVPTVLVFKGGQKVAQTVAVKTESELRKFLKDLW